MTEMDRLRELARRFVDAADTRVQGPDDMTYFDTYHDARMPLVVFLDELDDGPGPCFGGCGKMVIAPYCQDCEITNV